MLSFTYAAISVLISECCGSFEIAKYFHFPRLVPHCKRILRLSKETWDADRQRASIFTLEAFLEWLLNTVNKTFVDAPLKVLLLQGIYNAKDFKSSTFSHLLFAKICIMIVSRCLKRHKILTQTALQSTDRRNRHLRLLNAYFNLPMHQQFKNGAKSEFEVVRHRLFWADVAFAHTVDGFFSLLEVCASSYLAGARIRQLNASMGFSICVFGLLHILNLRNSSRPRNVFRRVKTRAERIVNSLFPFPFGEVENARDLKIHGATDWLLKTYATESKKVKDQIQGDPFKGVFDDCLDLVAEYLIPVSALRFGTGFDLNTYYLLQRSLASISLNVSHLKNTAESMTVILPFVESYFGCLEMAKTVGPWNEDVEEPLEQIRSIELQSVSFSYVPLDREEPAESIAASLTQRQLDNFTFTFEMGKVYSIIGRNGSGKSTLASVLAKLNTPSEGKILANGKDIKDISVDKWLEQFSIMPQAFSHLSNFSVRDNIALGSPKALNYENPLVNSPSCRKVETVEQT